MDFIANGQTNPPSPNNIRADSYDSNGVVMSMSSFLGPGNSGAMAGSGHNLPVPLPSHTSTSILSAITHSGMLPSFVTNRTQTHVTPTQPLVEQDVLAGLITRSWPDIDLAVLFLIQPQPLLRLPLTPFDVKLRDVSVIRAVPSHVYRRLDYPLLTPPACLGFCVRLPLELVGLRVSKVCVSAVW